MVRGDLREPDRLRAQAAQALVDAGEDRRERLPATEVGALGSPVVATGREHVDVLLAWIEILEPVAGRARDVDIQRRPHPAHVGRAVGREDVVHPPPGRAEQLRGVAVDGRRPRVPVAVHLVHRAQVDRRSDVAQVGRPAGDVAVEVAARDPLEAIVGLGRAPVVRIQRLPGEQRGPARVGDPLEDVRLHRRDPRAAAPVLIPRNDVDAAVDRGLERVCPVRGAAVRITRCVGAEQQPVRGACRSGERQQRHDERDGAYERPL